MENPFQHSRATGHDVSRDHFTLSQNGSLPLKRILFLRIIKEQNIPTMTNFKQIQIVKLIGRDLMRITSLVLHTSDWQTILLNGTFTLFFFAFTLKKTFSEPTAAVCCGGINTEHTPSANTLAGEEPCANAHLNTNFKSLTEPKSAATVRARRTATADGSAAAAGGSRPF